MSVLQASKIPQTTPEQNFKLLKDLERRGGSAALRADPKAFEDYITTIKAYPISEERMAKFVRKLSQAKDLNQKHLEGLTAWIQKNKLREIREAASAHGTARTGPELAQFASELERISKSLKNDPVRNFIEALRVLETAEKLGGSAGYAKYIKERANRSVKTTKASAATSDTTNQYGWPDIENAAMMFFDCINPWYVTIIVWTCDGPNGYGEAFTLAPCEFEVCGVLSHQGGLCGPTLAWIETQPLGPEDLHFVQASFEIGMINLGNLDGIGYGAVEDPDIFGEVIWE